MTWKGIEVCYLRRKWVKCRVFKDLPFSGKAEAERNHLPGTVVVQAGAAYSSSDFLGDRTDMAPDSWPPSDLLGTL